MLVRRSVLSAEVLTEPNEPLKHVLTNYLPNDDPRATNYVRTRLDHFGKLVPDLTLTTLLKQLPEYSTLGG